MDTGRISPLFTDCGVNNEPLLSDTMLTSWLIGVDGVHGVIGDLAEAAEAQHRTVSHSLKDQFRLLNNFPNLRTSSW